MNYQILFTKQAQKDAKKLSSTGIKDNTLKLIDVLKKDPFNSYPPYEKLLGNLAGLYSRRINIQHRLVYEALENDKTVKVLRMWSHYE